MKNKEKTVQKYFEALKDLHKVLLYTDKIQVGRWAKEHKITSSTASFLQKGGIIKKKNKNGVTWEWSTIPPNMKMAEELVNRINEKISSYISPASKTVKTTDKLILKFSVVKLLWGLIQIKINHHYDS